jgi:hypothetical protein
MTHIVTVENMGQTFYLRGTTWAFTRERADEFATFDQAQQALDTAKQFMKPKLAKKVFIFAIVA